MTDFIAHPHSQTLSKLSGTIKNLKVTRDHASFVFTQSDQTQMGVVAIATAVASMGGQAMSNAANASSMEEAADFVEFELNGQPVKGWVWRNPFHEGDTVDIAAEWQNDHYETFGIARPKDRTIALYPHCSRGATKHNKNAVKWWFIGGGACSAAFLSLGLLQGGWEEEEFNELSWFVFGLAVAFFLSHLLGPIGWLIVGLAVIALLLATLYIETNKDNKLQEWLARCHFGSHAEQYQSHTEEAAQLKLALA